MALGVRSAALTTPKGSDYSIGVLFALFSHPVLFALLLVCPICPIFSFCALFAVFSLLLICRICRICPICRICSFQFAAY